MSKRKNSPATTPVQGEGDYEAARRYDAAQQDFVKSGEVEPAARRAAPEDAAQAEQMQQAEDKAAAHAKGEDPTVSHGSGGSRQSVRGRAPRRA